ncbi:hypothetical protein E2C01_089306 [Portunus trituberculatus]|uniref:Uncharacterized protein n=1 Tax=Portunus trituberculatus TaxID=210409 RepID=A0A5B7JD66_PORTR|nr:hypothetical protein [Portunus trituberculatus]
MCEGAREESRQIANYVRTNHDSTISFSTTTVQRAVLGNPCKVHSANVRNVSSW